MWAGTNDHLLMKASPPDSSSRNTRALTTMMAMVAMGRRTGRREASLRGIMAVCPFDGYHCCCRRRGHIVLPVEQFGNRSIFRFHCTCDLYISAYNLHSDSIGEKGVTNAIQSTEARLATQGKTGRQTCGREPGV